MKTVARLNESSFNLFPVIHYIHDDGRNGHLIPFHPVHILPRGFVKWGR